jgi:hypothetical protein
MLTQYINNSFHLDGWKALLAEKLHLLFSLLRPTDPKNRKSAPGPLRIFNGENAKA